MGRKSISCNNPYCSNGALCAHCTKLQPKEEPKLEEPQSLEGKLEPEARPCSSVQEAAALSLAISMKRIADAVCGDDKNSGIAQAIWDISNRSQ